MRLIFSSTLFLVAGVAVSASADDPVRFNRDIRPILSDTCFKCHGFDPNTREADLRLDVREAALAERKGKHPIVPGDAKASDIIARLISDDPEKRMPPPETGKELTAAQIDTVRRWIDQGAKYEQHWSFIPPARPELPAVKDTEWPRNAIDRFILARLDAEGLAPSGEADRTTLIRRVTLDLTGVPPTPTEVDAFVNDTAADAYEKVVDRLLASLRFGERMAVPWLDAARYADTMGYQADWERFQWRWRTWVIDAYNANMPFDRFTIEQIAGDLLPKVTTEQLIATGFNRNHRINDEGGIIPEEYLVEYIVDRVETTSATWMGLTMGCARCHDHKYDPITQKDFYRFFAYFYNVPEKGKEGRKGYANPVIRVAVRGKQAAWDAHKETVAAHERELKDAVAKLAPQRNAWIAATAAKLTDAKGAWRIAEPTDVDAQGAVDFKKLGDGSYLATGDNLQFPVYTVELKPGAGQVTGLRLEALRHAALTNKSLSPGNGNFVLTEFEVQLHRAGQAKPTRLKIASAAADYAQDKWAVAGAIDGRKQTGWAVDGHRKIEDRTAVFTLAKPVKIGNDDRLIVTMRHESEHARHSIGRFRLSTTAVARPSFGNNLGLPGDVTAALRTAPAKRNVKQKARLAAHYASIDPKTKSLRTSVDTAKKSLAAFEIEFVTYVMVMQEMAKPRDTHILDRGVYTEKREKVTMGVPETVLGKMPTDAPKNRLGLARWLVSGEHPLTARVTVNRYWAMLFGGGIVKTVEDFGFQGEYPSHPDLLDWLATEYPRIGWDTKAMLKQMVMSATYRQRSEWTDALRERDPENRLLARQSRLRLPSEMIRDQALFTSGLLVEKIGGKSVKPYQPAGLWSEVSFQSKSRTTDFYVQDTGEKLYRRSLYTFWKRSMPPPGMATFDAPSREMCILSRPRTNTPLQALLLLNDVTYVEASRALAERAIRESGDDAEARIGYAFRMLLAREPDAAEMRVLAGGYAKRIAFYRQNTAAAKKLVARGESKPSAEVDPIELAALTTVVMNILNLDETINRE